MAQLQELGNLEPSERQRLMEDLKQTDPRLWQDLIRQFRATLAYRQQAGAGQKADDVSSQLPVEASKPPEKAIAPRSSSIPSVTVANAESQKPATQSSLKETAMPVRQSSDRSSPQQTDVQESGDPSKSATAITDSGLGGDKTVPQPGDGRVEQASYTTGVPDWHGELQDTIRSLEASVPAQPDSAEQVAQHARLRMLYLLAGRREDALRPIPSASPSIQDFWAKELYGLAAWLDTQRNADPARRAAEAKQHLGEAVARLAETSPLVVRSLAFVTNIQSYGSYKKFAEYKFKPGQEVLLYAEIENFASQATENGYETNLRFGYQIFDSRGQRVAEHEFTAKEQCLNLRRDFFIGYQFHLPTRIYDGQHTLQLTVEDLQSQKIGQSSIDFTVDERRK